MEIGIWQTIPQPAISRYLGLMGWDWIVLDLQHGSMTWETAYECIYAARPTGARPLIRTSIVLLPVTGYLISTSEGAGIDMFGAFELPALFEIP